MFAEEAKERARKLEESQTLGVYDNDEDYARDSGWNDGEVAGYEEGFIDGAEFGYNKAKEEVKAPYPSYKHLFGESIEQTALRHSNDLINSLRVDIDYAKTVIQDLLNNSGEYARQRAMDFLKEN